MSQPFKLYRLQQLDSQLDSVRARLTEIEVLLNDNEQLQQALLRSESAIASLNLTKKSLQKAENYTAQQRVKIEQTESTLYGGKIRNPKELQDLQNELGALKRYLAVLEDRQLECMLEEEQMGELEKNAALSLQQEHERMEKSHAALKIEQNRLIKEMAHLEDERRVAVSSIEEQDYLLYEQLRRDRRGVAVARVSDRACSACGSTLSAMLLQAARSQNQLNRCDTCGRFLYVG